MLHDLSPWCCAHHRRRPLAYWHLLWCGLPATKLAYSMAEMHRNPVDVSRLKTPGPIRACLTLSRERVWAWTLSLTLFPAGQACCMLYLKAGGVPVVGTVLSLVAVICSGIILPHAIYMICRWYVVRGFRIVVFRRNSGEHAESHRQVVLSTCGSFGQIISISDPCLRRTLPDAGTHGVTNVLADFEFLVPSTPEGWREVVVKELQAADLVVLDWRGEVTENMRWECKQAASLMPGHRVLVIIGQDVPAEPVLDSFDSVVRAVRLPAERGPGAKTMRHALYTVLRSLASELRQDCYAPRDRGC